MKKQKSKGENKKVFFKNLKLLVGAVFFVLIVIILFIYTQIKKNQLENLRKKELPEIIKKVVNDPSIKIEIKEIKEISGVIQFQLVLSRNSSQQTYTSYLTKDKKILFTSGIKIDEINQTTNQKSSQKRLTCQDLVKTKTPKLTAFVVSQCPFGLQMQRVFKKAIEQLPSLESYLEVRYIGSINNNQISSMHGEEEAKENLRQICIREEQKEKYWPYVGCYMKEGKTDECLKEALVDGEKLTECIKNPQRGLRYAQTDFSLANKFNIGGSPTLLLNEKQIVSEFDFGGRTADTIKQIICCAMTTQADFCKKEISKENIAPSFSHQDTTSASTSSSGCGN